MGNKLVSWGEIYTAFILKYPENKVKDFKPYKPNTIYIWLDDGTEVTYNYESRKKTEVNKGSYFADLYKPNLCD